MYNAHFGLTRPPFRITPDTTLFYSGAERGSVLEALSYVVMSGEGITKVIGEVGSGKTMLCRMLEEKLSPQRVDTIYVANPAISPENILTVLAFEAGLIRHPDQIHNKLETLQLLQRWLLEKHAANRYVVVLIEEAQGMPLETLEEIRLLSNLETEQGKLLQIVLFGQPELDEKLANVSIRQLKERIAHNFYLSPLNRRQIREYLNFRMRSAGYHGPDLFDDKTTLFIAYYSAGLIRRVNILADKILLAAYAEGTTRLTPTLVRKAAADCQFGSFNGIGGGFSKGWLSAAAGVAVGVLLAGLVWWLGHTPAQDTLLKPAPALNQPSDTRTPVVGGAVQTGLPEAGDRQPDEDIPGLDAPPVLLLKEDGSANAGESPGENNGPLAFEAGPRGLALVSGGTDATATDIIESRLVATRNWLAAAGESQYSIQLMTIKSDSAGNLNSYLRELPKTIELSDIFVYETRIGGEAMYGVLYQAFNTRASAQARLRDMPDSFKPFEPFLLRSVKGLRGEIARSNS